MGVWWRCRRRWAGLIAAAALAVAALLGPGVQSAPAQGLLDDILGGLLGSVDPGLDQKDVPRVRVKSTPPKAVSRTRSVPITRRAKSGRRTVMSLGLDRLGRLRDSRLLSAAEVQLTTCLMGRHCPGRQYRFDPRVDAWLTLSPSAKAPGGSSVRRLTKTRRLTCTHRQPDSNHHCVVSIPWNGFRFDGTNADVPCLGSGCRVNLVVSAHHPRASGGQRLLVGGDEGKRGNRRGEARISVALLRGAVGAAQLRRPRPRRKSLPLSRAGKDPLRRVVASVPVRNPARGEALVVEARYLGALGGLPYNARTRTSIVLADRPRATRAGSRSRRVAATSTNLAIETNFNCTRGPSGHRTPCPIRKAGVVRFRHSAERPVYVNLVAGHGAIGPGSERWARRDRIRVGRRGFLDVRRFSPDP